MHAVILEDLFHVVIMRSNQYDRGYIGFYLSVRARALVRVYVCLSVCLAQNFNLAYNMRSFGLEAPKFIGLLTT